MRPPPLASVCLCIAFVLAGCTRTEPDESGAGENETPSTTTPMTTPTLTPTATPILAGTSQSCGAKFAGPAGDNARLLGVLKADPESVVQRFGSALDEVPTGAPTPEADGSIAWATQNGTIRYQRWDVGGEPRVRVEFKGPAQERSAEEARVLLDLTLRIFHVDTSAGAFNTERIAPDVAFEQTFRNLSFPGGGHVKDAPETVVALGPLFEVDEGWSAISTTRAEEIATDYAKCLARPVRDAQALSVDVRDESVVWSVLVTLDRPRSDDCAPSIGVHVDAETGAVRGEYEPACD